MATYIVNINEKTKMGKAIVNLLASSDYVTLSKAKNAEFEYKEPKKNELDGMATKKRKCGLDKALEDIKKGRVYKAKSVKDLMDKIYEE